jgi:hypothetical protein
VQLHDRCVHVLMYGRQGKKTCCALLCVVLQDLCAVPLSANARAGVMRQQQRHSQLRFPQGYSSSMQTPHTPWSSTVGALAPPLSMAQPTPCPLVRNSSAGAQRVQGSTHPLPPGLEKVQRWRSTCARLNPPLAPWSMTCCSTGAKRLQWPTHPLPPVLVCWSTGATHLHDTTHPLPPGHQLKLWCHPSSSFNLPLTPCSVFVV